MEFEYTVTEMCEVTNVSRRTLYKWVAKGMPKAAPGRFDIRQCVQWLLHNTSSNDSLDEARQQLCETQTRKIELDMEVLKGTLIKADDAHHLVAEIVQEVTSSFDSLPPRVSADLAALDGIPDVEALLDNECRRIRETAAQRVGELISTGKPGKKHRRTPAKRVNGRVGRPKQGAAAGIA